MGWEKAFLVPAESFIYGREQKFTGQSLLSNDDVPYVRATRQAIEGGYEYSVESAISLERTAISTLMQLPFGSALEPWQDVLQELRDIAHPSRHIRALTRSAFMSERLAEVRPAAQSLADIMANNQDFQTRTVNVPAFNYGQAQLYSAKQLFNFESERKLLLMLKSVGLDPVTARKIGNSIFGVEQQSEEFVKELEELTGVKSIEAQVAAILNEVDASLVVELQHRYQSEHFTGFQRQAEVLRTGELLGGGKDPLVFLRDEDVPPVFANADTNVSIGPTLRDKDTTLNLGRDKDGKKIGIERRQVTFHTQTPRHVAYPRVVWRDVNGERTLAFPVDAFKTGTERVVRTSTLAGAALVASSLGFDIGIDYSEATRPNPRVSRKQGQDTVTRDKDIPILNETRYWPLVAHYRQDDLLAHPYFIEIEEVLAREKPSLISPEALE